MKKELQMSILIPIILLAIIGSLSIFFPTGPTTIQTVFDTYVDKNNENYYYAGYNDGYKQGYIVGYNYSQSKIAENMQQYLANITTNTNITLTNISYTYSYEFINQSFTDFTMNNHSISILNQTSMIITLHLNLTLNICLYTYSCSELGLIKDFNDTISFVLIQDSSLNMNINYFGNSTLTYFLSISQGTIMPIYNDIYLLICMDSFLNK